MTILDEIVATKRVELERSASLDELCAAAAAAPPPRDFAGALRDPGGRLRVVAELKRRSPSKGALAPDLDPPTTAHAYEAGGAAALSVLTDHTYFGGSADDLRAARDAVAIPVLRKDFTIDARQVYEARAMGADALLLIVAAVPDGALLKDLLGLAVEIGLAAVVEAHDATEIDRALEVGAAIVGVNARDLATFTEDLSVAERLAAHLPASVIAVAESAIRSAEDARRMADAGYDAVLVGEALVRSDDPTALVGSMTTPIVRRRGT